MVICCHYHQGFGEIVVIFSKVSGVPKINNDEQSAKVVVTVLWHKPWQNGAAGAPCLEVLP